MTAGAEDRSAVLATVEATGIWKNWGRFLALGIVQIIAGTVAVGFVLSATLASAVTLGVLLLIAGFAQLPRRSRRATGTGSSCSCCSGSSTGSPDS